jgi:DMSO/TMAO reductase YedYZ heme-binding membrane subunit
VTATATRPMPAASRNPVDAWMEGSWRFAGTAFKRKTIAMIILGLPALAPLFFISRPVIERSSATLTGVNADVLGSGSMLLLLATLAVTPAVTLTGQHWFIPLRRWYGVVLFCNALADAVIASITGNFTGGVPGRIFGHTFLLAGLMMVLIMAPLAITANAWSMRWLGRYWKTLQRLTYLVWGLLFVHLALLEGFGIQNGQNGPSGNVDGTPLLHQRFYQLAAVSLLLVLLRIPPVRRWVTVHRRLALAAFTPLIALAILAFAYIINEEVFKGVGAFRLQLPGGDG